MILAHVQNLVASQTFSYVFFGMSRVHHKLHMACGIAHTQPPPERIDAPSVMTKQLTKKYEQFWSMTFALRPRKALKSRITLRNKLYESLEEFNLTTTVRAAHLNPPKTSPKTSPTHRNSCFSLMCKP